MKSGSETVPLEPKMMEQMRSENADAPGKHSWIALLMILFASIICMMAQFKPTPVQVELMSVLGVSLDTVGNLTSIFSLGGLVMAFASGRLMKILGLKRSFLLGFVLLAIGGFLGVAAGQVEWLLVARLVEGFGMGSVICAAPTAITRWFPGKRQGVAMGLWSADIPLGVILMMIFGPILGTAYGWRSLWWLTSILAIIAFILFATLYQKAPTEYELEESESKTSFAAVLKRPPIWMLSIIYLALNLTIASAMAVFYPTYLELVAGYDSATASLINTGGMIGIIIMSPLAGFVVDKIGGRTVLVLATAMGAISMLFPFLVTAVVPSFLLQFLTGVASGAIPTAAMTCVVPAVGSAALTGQGMSMLVVFRNIGMVLGPTLMGAIAFSLGWATAGFILAGIMGVAFLAAVLFVSLWRNRKVGIGVENDMD